MDFATKYPHLILKQRTQGEHNTSDASWNILAEGWQARTQSAILSSDLWARWNNIGKYRRYCRLQVILALDIDRSHRVGNPTRQLANLGISMFSSQLIDCSRQNFYKKRTLLKDNGYLGVFANEDLTKFGSGMLYEARKLAKKELINNTWSANR